MELLNLSGHSGKTANKETDGQNAGEQPSLQEKSGNGSNNNTFLAPAPGAKLVPPEGPAPTGQQVRQAPSITPGPGGAVTPTRSQGGKRSSDSVPASLPPLIKTKTVAAAVKEGVVKQDSLTLAENRIEVWSRPTV